MKNMLVVTLVVAFLVGCKDSESQTNQGEQPQTPQAAPTPPSVSVLDEAFSGNFRYEGFYLGMPVEELTAMNGLEERTFSFLGSSGRLFIHPDLGNGGSIVVEQGRVTQIHAVKMGPTVRDPEEELHSLVQAFGKPASIQKGTTWQVSWGQFKEGSDGEVLAKGNSVTATLNKWMIGISIYRGPMEWHSVKQKATNQLPSFYK